MAAGSGAHQENHQALDNEVARYEVPASYWGGLQGTAVSKGQSRLCGANSNSTGSGAQICISGTSAAGKYP